jgi:hypothetical protein
VGNAQASNQIAQGNKMSGLIQGGLQAAVMSSDERVKKNIELISKEDIQEFKSVIKPVTYEYIDASKDGEGIFPGIIAQDLEKSKLGKLIVFEDQNYVKKIDLHKAISLLLAIQGDGV